MDAVQNGCTYRMPGEVEIIENPDPLKFVLFISRHFCKGLHQADLSLNESENDLMMEYQLQKWNGTQWVAYLDKLRGTGDTLTWSGIPEGTYKVVAKNGMTGCQSDMTGIVEVLERDLPSVYALVAQNNDSVYCANANPDVVLILQGSEPMTKYSLLKSDGSVYRAGASDTVWRNVESGIYTVRAENQWGCTQVMVGQVVFTWQPPSPPLVNGGFGLCGVE